MVNVLIELCCGSLSVPLLCCAPLQLEEHLRWWCRLLYLNNLLDSSEVCRKTCACCLNGLYVLWRCTKEIVSVKRTFNSHGHSICIIAERRCNVCMERAVSGSDRYVLVWHCFLRIAGTCFYVVNVLGIDCIYSTPLVFAATSVVNARQLWLSRSANNELILSTPAHFPFIFGLVHTRSQQAAHVGIRFADGQHSV